MMRLRRASVLASLFLVTGTATAGPPELIRTSQMWGTETGAGKTNARVGIAAECLQEADRSLKCQFVSISASNTNQCEVVTWGRFSN
jgi:predicted Abi (CAAX) family protease